MVASRTKARALVARLQQENPPERVDRLRSPAGLDLGSFDPEEIALSVVAEIVALRHSRRASCLAEPTPAGALGGAPT